MNLIVLMKSNIKNVVVFLSEIFYKVFFGEGCGEGGGGGGGGEGVTSIVFQRVSGVDPG